MITDRFLAISNYAPFLNSVISYITEMTVRQEDNADKTEMMIVMVGRQGISEELFEP